MSITLTKVRLPQRSKDVLRRARLIDALHQNLHRKLTFVSAPAGYGKTTLLVDFASDVDAVVCWYSIGAGDYDLVPFFQHVVMAFQHKYPDFGHDFGDLTNSSGAPDPSSLAAELINEAVNQIDDFTVLILDDYHIAGEHQPIVDFVESLLERLPDQVRVVIGSRSVYGIPTANLYVREDLSLLNASDLRFTAEELQKLVDRNFHHKLSEEDAAQLAERSDGWIVAILLAVRTMGSGSLPSFEGAKENVYQFLAEDVITQQPAHLQDFLLSTSVVDEFTESLANHLRGEMDAGAAIQELEERNLFLTRIQADRETNFRYHQLFVDFLRDRLAKAESERMESLHARAAEWYREREMWELAVKHELATGDRETAARWMDKVANQLFVAGHQNTLDQWHSALAQAPDLRGRAPRLLLNQAKVLFSQSAVEEGEELLDLAEAGLRREEDVEQIANLLTTRGMLRRFQGKHAEAIDLADEALTLLGKRKGSEQREYRRYQAERLKGFSLNYVEQADEAIEHLTRATDGFRRLVNADSADQTTTYQHDLGEALTDLGLVYFENGRVLEGQKVLQKALDIKRKLRSNRGSLAIALNNAAYLHYLVGHYREARRLYDESIEAARSAQWRRITIDILNGKADLLADLDEWEEARDLYFTAQNISEEDNELQLLNRTHRKLANLERLRGNYSEALNYLRESVMEEENATEAPSYKTSLGAIYLSMGQYELAETELREAFEALKDAPRPKQENAMVAFLLGEALFKEGKEGEAEHLLALALQWVAQLGYDQFLVTEGRRAQDYLEHSLSARPTPQLESLVQRVKTFQTGKGQLEVEAAVAAIPQMNLEVRALGPGQVWMNGELIVSSEWRATGARALFFFIVDREGIRKEDVAQEFWPDFSPAKVSSNFHSSLWRVRKALGGKENIIFENEHYRLHPSIDWWYDVAEFASLIETANTDKVTETERHELWRQAIELYQGDYLPDIFMDWADRRQKELQELYLGAMTSLANWELERKHYTEAREMFERVLSIDPYRDLVHLGLMRSLANSRSPSSAKAHYQAYKEMLWTELQIEPLPELREFFEELS